MRPSAVCIAGRARGWGTFPPPCARMWRKGAHWSIELPSTEGVACCVLVGARPAALLPAEGTPREMLGEGRAARGGAFALTEP